MEIPHWLVIESEWQKLTLIGRGKWKIRIQKDEAGLRGITKGIV